MPHRALDFISESLPGVDTSDLTGKLIAFEGNTSQKQIERVADWLMVEGYPVHVSPRMSTPPEFAEELELRMIPALRKGFIVLTESYSWSFIVKGGNNKRVEKVMGFALLPTMTCYLRSSDSGLDKLADKYGFVTLDANQPEEALFRELRSRISGALGLDQTSATPARPRHPSARRKPQS